MAALVAVSVLSFGERARAEPVTIAVLGDSLVHGYGLPEADGFVPQLQSWLDEQGAETLLINAGVSGDTTSGGLARLDWTLTDDVQALILSLGGNDVLRGIDPALARTNLDTMLSRAAERGVPVMLVGISAPTNYGADYKAEFDAIHPDLAAQYETVFYPVFLKTLLDLPDRSDTLSKYMQNDGLHPNAKGVALIVQDMGPYVLDLVARVATP